ncbi:hypothetical protein [Tautonia rosea]|uniref:hypothetical protein n=1 Tax=Tautonia rosea TaxID=2728037 RepID=UPI0014752554|nr:hypothetical protein [Tautonia rosea]
MGLELILFTYAVGLILFLYGVSVLLVGRIFLSPRSARPIRGLEARAWELLCVLLSVIWFLTITSAWGALSRT